MSEKTFKAASAILYHVPYSEGYVDEENLAINWSGVWSAEATSKASTEQKALVRLAYDVANLGRSINDLEQLSYDMKAAVLNALSYLS